MVLLWSYNKQLPNVVCWFIFNSNRQFHSCKERQTAKLYFAYKFKPSNRNQNHRVLLRELPMDYRPNGISSPHKNKGYSMRLAFNSILVGVLFTYQKKAIKELYCIVQKKKKKNLCCLFASSQKLKKVSVKMVNHFSRSWAITKNRSKKINTFKTRHFIKRESMSQE